MANPFVAEIRIMPFNFPPKGWAQCDGQILPISQNTALYSLLGTTYGGDGRSTYALPNLQGSAAMDFGQGNNLSPYNLGDSGGSNTHTLLASEMPAHNHGDVHANSSPATSPTATSSSAIGVTPTSAFGPTYNMAAMGGNVGGGLEHENRQPYLVLNFCIALQGVYPSRT